MGKRLAYLYPPPAGYARPANPKRMESILWQLKKKRQQR